MIVYRRLFGVATATVAMAILFGGVGASADDDGECRRDVTCSGGSIASGVYSNLKISGVCIVDAGSVTVEHDLTVLPGASLIAVTGGSFTTPVGSDVTVRGDIDVQKDAILILGCEPSHFICSNDPDQKVGSYLTKDTVGGNLRAHDALSVLVHSTVIGHDVSLEGGGGGVSCSSAPPTLGGSPPYGDFEDDIIGGDLRIKGWQSCWLGFFRDTILQNVEFKDNLNADPDANEIAGNSIVGNLSCTGNSPAPQTGDSGVSLSTVFGHVKGQCASAKLVH